MFPLALGVFRLDLGCGEHFMVGAHEELFIPCWLRRAEERWIPPVPVQGMPTVT